MRRFRFALAVGFVPTALQGCASAPELPDEKRVSMPSIIRQLRCEAFSATKDYRPETPKTPPSTPMQKFVGSLAIGYTITLEVKDTGGVNTNAASATWGVPITLGLFSLKAAGGVNEVARRTGAYEGQFLVRDVWVDGDAVCRQDTPDEPASRVDLQGSFGVDTWLERAIGTKSEISQSDVFKSTGTTIEFVLTPSIGVTPSWAITRAGGRKFDGIMPVSWSREFNNKIDIAITQNTGGGFKVQPVCFAVDKNGEKCIYGTPSPGAGTFNLENTTPGPGKISPDAQRRLQDQLDDLKLQGLRRRLDLE